MQAKPVFYLDTGSRPQAPAVLPLGALRRWLWCCALFVVLMVLVGGATRLTGSGLSITQWQPLHGVIPPLSAADWQTEFDGYKQIGQFRQDHPDMTLAEFQGIFWWEWAHRMLGRVTGLVFLLPLLYFAATGALTRAAAAKLAVLIALVPLQATVGWWMVMSGLNDERVSVAQDRLAIHLVLACLIYAAALWSAENFRDDSPRYGESRGLRAGALGLVALVLVQIFMGGIVAGLHAGLDYNTWPLMDGALAPHGLFAQGIASVFDDIATAQFLHRMTAYALLAAAVWHWQAARASALRRGTIRMAALLCGLVALQAVLGIATLLLVVPLPLALLHQLTAVIVLGAAVVHARRICEGEAMQLDLSHQRQSWGSNS